MKTLALIPARGGSKGIPRKNLAPIAGRPLIAWTIEAARAASTIDRVVVSTDDEEIVQVSRSLGAECPFLRPAELAADDTPALPVVEHAVDALQRADGWRPDLIVLLQPTSPLRQAIHIDESVRRLAASCADSLVSVVAVPHQFGPYSVLVRDGEQVRPFLPWDESRNLRQQKPQFWARNGAAVYAFRYECLERQRSIYGRSTIGYEMSKEDSIDIDDPVDLRFAEMVLRERLAASRLLPAAG